MEKDGATLVLFKNDKRDQIFLVQRDDYFIWNLTGGGIERKEKPIEAAIREAKEETGFEIKLLRFVGLYKIINRKGSLIRKSYLFEGRVLSGKFKPEFPRCLGRWFSIKCLPPDITHSQHQKIFDVIHYQKKQPFITTRRDEKLWTNFHLLFYHPFSGLKYIFNL